MEMAVEAFLVADLALVEAAVWCYVHEARTLAERVGAEVAALAVWRSKCVAEGQSLVERVLLLSAAVTAIWEVWQVWQRLAFLACWD